MLFAKLEDIWATTLTYEGGAEWVDYSYTEGGLPMADNAKGNAILQWLLARLKEPTTWMGISAFIAAVGPALATGDWRAALLAAGGALGIVIPEKSGK